MPKTVGVRKLKDQTSPVSPEKDTEQPPQVEIDSELAELKALARRVAGAWISDKSGVELVAEQRT